jgi:uncharacterized membrane protein YfcA
MNYWWQQLLLLLASLVANTFSAFSGGGAGLVQFPVLIFLGLPFGVALATHKIATVALGLGATVRHWRERTVERRLGIQMLLWGVPGVLLGAGMVLQIPGRWAELALGVLTIGLGVYSMSRRDLGVTHAPRQGGRRDAVIGGFGLFVIGFLNGSLSSGTGLFCTLWLVRWYGLDYRRAVAYTLIFVGMFWNGAGAATLGVLGHVQWSWLPVLLLGSLVGGYLGAHWAIMKGNRWIKRGFEVVTVLIGLKLIL